MRRWLLAPFAAMLIATPVLAQSPLGVATGIGFESYSFGQADSVGMDGLTLRTIPIAAHLDVARWLGVDVATAHAAGKLVLADGTESTISGFTDTQLQMTVPFGSDRTSVVLTGVAIVPTGFTSHAADQLPVAGVMAADLLPLRISNWGTGGGYALNAAVARALGPVSLGISAGYRIGAEYDPLESADFSFRPGNELRVRVAMDRNVRGSGKLSLHATLFSYQEDQLDGNNLYTSGNRIQAVGSYAYPMGTIASGVTYAGVLHRQRGSVTDPMAVGAITTAADLPAQQLYVFGTGARVPFGRHRLLPSLDARLFRREDGVGQGYVLGVGTSAELHLSGYSSDFSPAVGGGFVLVPSLAVRLGHLVVSEGRESGLMGIDLGLGVRMGGGR